MQKENSTVSAFKVWIFPSLVSVLAVMIWNDVNEIKADVKALMAQSNIDKTRIDNLERQVYRSATNYPTPINQLPEQDLKMAALLPDNKQWLTEKY